MSLKQVGVALVLAGLVGCATSTVVDATDESSIRDGLKEGDRVTITTGDFQRLEITVLEVSDSGIEGEARDGEIVIVPYDDIDHVSVREARPARTAGAVVGGIVGTAVVIYVAAIVASIAVLGAVL